MQQAFSLFFFIQLSVVFRLFFRYTERIVCYIQFVVLYTENVVHCIQFVVLYTEKVVCFNTVCCFIRRGFSVVYSLLLFMRKRL